MNIEIYFKTICTRILRSHFAFAIIRRCKGKNKSYFAENLSNRGFMEKQDTEIGA